MESLVSLRGYDEDLQRYLLEHKFPAVLESLLTGLIVMTPDDPWNFLLTCLHQISQNELGSPINRVQFVSEDKRPALMMSRHFMLDNVLDELDLPPQEVMEQVFEFRKRSLLRMSFRAWEVYNAAEKKASESFRKRLQYAKVFYSLKVSTSVFGSWKRYSAQCTGNRRQATAKLTAMSNAAMLKLLFYAWLEDFKETRKARNWSKAEGTRDNKDSEEGWHWPEGEDPISLLPGNVQVQIFRNVGLQGLCRCAQVCRSWNQITKEPQLWNKVNFHPVCHLVTDEALLKITKKYRPLLCHLNLHGCMNLSSDSLKKIGLCQNIQDLNLADVKAINEEVIDLLGRACAGLFYLNLSDCYISDSLLLLLTKHFSSLHYLSLARCQQFTSKGLHSITSGKGCRRLLYLDLTGCTQITEEGFGHIGRGCSILNTVILDDIPDMSDRMILSLVSHCKTLRHISFMGGSKLSDKPFIFLAMENRRLRTIKIEKNFYITDATVKMLGMKCRDLSHLFLAGCPRVSDNGMKSLSRLKKLEVLNIADCVRISDLGIRYILDSEYMESLRELNLTNLSRLSDLSLFRLSHSSIALTCLSFCYCDCVSDSGVDMLGHIPSLVSLDLSGCNISDDGMQSLRHNPQIRYLMVAELSGLTDDGLQKLCASLPYIDTLDLSYCEQITDKGVEQLTFYCRIVRTLYLANCHQLSDTSTRCMVKGSSYLSHLDLSGCSITDRSLVSLRKSSLPLQQLDILSCTGVTREAVLKLQQKGVSVRYNTEQPKYLSHKDSNLPDVPLVSLIDRL